MRLLLRLAMLLCVGQTSANAVTIIVTNNSDHGPGCLRQAIADAQDGDTIRFDSTVASILVGSELVIDKDTKIIGPGVDYLGINATGPFRIFHIMPGHIVTLANFQSQASTGGNVLNDNGNLTIEHCYINGWRTPQSGGGAIYNDGSTNGATLVIRDTRIVGLTSGEGGGIFNGANATLTVIGSVITDSHASRGAGIYNSGTATIRNSLVMNSGVGSLEGLVLTEGGGILNTGNLTHRFFNRCATVGKPAGPLNGRVFRPGRQWCRRRNRCRCHSLSSGVWKRQWFRSAIRKSPLLDVANAFHPSLVSKLHLGTHLPAAP